MRLALETDVRVVGEAGDGAEALKLVGELDPDVVVLDVWMPGIDGLAATQAITAVAPRCRVVILTLHDDAHTRRRAEQVGASDLVGKQARPEVLLAAIRRAAESSGPAASPATRPQPQCL